MEINIVGWIMLIAFGGILLLAYIITIAVESGVEGDWEETKWTKCIVGIPFVAFTVFAACFGSSKIKENKQSHWNTFQYNIVSLERESSIEGRFVLGSGYLESSQKYYFYQDLGNKNYKLRSLDHQYTYIHEYSDLENIHTPCVYEWKEVNTLTIYYTIYVPENTIIKEYHA